MARSWTLPFLDAGQSSTHAKPEVPKCIFSQVAQYPQQSGCAVTAALCRLYPYCRIYFGTSLDVLDILLMSMSFQRKYPPSQPAPGATYWLLFRGSDILAQVNDDALTLPQSDDPAIAALSPES